jgi:hypothetical protein
MTPKTHFRAFFRARQLACRAGRKDGEVQNLYLELDSDALSSKLWP